MKNITLYKLLLSTVCVCLLTACEDFLEKEPPLYVTEADVFTDPERLESNVNSLYLGLKHNYVLGGKLFAIVDNMGDELVHVSSNVFELVTTYDMKVGASTQENYQLWDYTYRAINRCNTFLKNIETYKEYAGSNYDRYVAEAKFVRALGYYYLHEIYTMPYVLEPNAKSVVLRLQAEADIQNNDMARFTSQAVLDQILEDLSFSEALPVGSNSEKNVIRATQGAAEMLKMRIYMIMGDWSKAIQAGKKVTGYSLVSDVSTLYKAPYYSTESIFSMPFDATNRPGTQTAIGYFYINGKSNKLDVKAGIVSKEGYGNLKDARIAKLTTIPSGGEFITKYTSTTYLDWLPVFRYAETLLNLAECYYNTGEYDEAIQCVKQVRQRSLAPEDDTLTLDGLTGEALKTAIYNERRLELLCEGVRGLDIHRRGETFTKQPGTIYESITVPSQTINGYIWAIPQVERAQNKLIDN
ncbi:MAG: RagB/SusD family nutrient uptake outer membrane protein [Tannerellaceae bacterium]|jgi:tetratricopeptide (TPR) repeat protein|nr:RagB/SusD family nutrient uptake outer membrane protein [Tannerellaceae bacterium]